MKKLIPFKKELFFNNNVYEIVSISLEHTLHHERDYLISGEFIITGEYKITEASINTESFEFKVPFDINIDEHYNLDHLIIDIDDFYYETINNNVLSVNIEVLLDKLEENRCIDEEELIEKQELIENVFKEEPVNIIEEKIEAKLEEAKESLEKAAEKIKDIEDKVKGFVTYRVYIVKEEDTIDKIFETYKTNRECLEKYNNLDEIKAGDKLIIPSND